MMNRATRSVVETSSSTTKWRPLSMTGGASSLALRTGGVSKVDWAAPAYAGAVRATTGINCNHFHMVRLRSLVEALDGARLQGLVDRRLGRRMEPEDGEVLFAWHGRELRADTMMSMLGALPGAELRRRDSPHVYGTRCAYL